MNDLLKYFIENKRKGITKYIHYFDIYDKYFSKFRGEEVNVLEIGIGEGGSLQMWKDYFGPKANIYGLDYHDCKKHEEDQIKTFHGNQTDKEFLKKIGEEIKPIHVLIDDGSHTPAHQIISFEGLFEYIDLGGIYLCEDMSFNYSDNYEGGGYKSYGSALEYFKDQVDYIYGYFNADRGDAAKNISKEIYSIDFFTNLTVIQKKSKMDHISPVKTGEKYTNIEIILERLKCSGIKI